MGHVWSGWDGVNTASPPAVTPPGWYRTHAPGWWVLLFRHLAGHLHPGPEAQMKTAVFSAAARLANSTMIIFKLLFFEALLGGGDIVDTYMRPSLLSLAPEDLKYLPDTFIQGDIHFGKAGSASPWRNSGFRVLLKDPSVKPLWWLWDLDQWLSGHRHGSLTRWASPHPWTCPGLQAWPQPPFYSFGDLMLAPHSP